MKHALPVLSSTMSLLINGRKRILVFQLLQEKQETCQDRRTKIKNTENKRSDCRLGLRTFLHYKFIFMNSLCFRSTIFFVLETSLYVMCGSSCILLLAAFENLQKATSFILSVCLSVCLSIAWNNSAPLDGFLLNTILGYFRKSVANVQVLLKCGKSNGYFTRRHMYIYYNI
jgi:hypothetical protein